VEIPSRCGQRHGTLRTTFSTIILNTTAWVRKFDLATIDFTTVGGTIFYILLDQKKAQDVEDITLGK